MLHFMDIKASEMSGGEPTRWLVVLHGMLGAGRNWMGPMRRFVERRPEFGVMLVDLPGHGRSSAQREARTLRDCAHEVASTLHSTGRVIDSICGHSFGGKVALTMTQAGGIEARQTWLIDSTPAPVPFTGDTRRAFDALDQNPGPFATRERAIADLTHAGLSPNVSQWLATNLKRGNDGFAWRFDLEQLKAMMEDFCTQDLWPCVESCDHALRFVKAEGADVVTEDVFARLEQIGQQHQNITLHRLAGGHWLNMDNPEGVIDLLAIHL
jgi:esterase